MMQQSFEFIVLIREKIIDMYGKITRISFQTRLHFMAKMDIYSLTVLYNKIVPELVKRCCRYPCPIVVQFLYGILLEIHLISTVGLPLLTPYKSTVNYLSLSGTLFVVFC